MRYRQHLTPMSWPKLEHRLIVEGINASGEHVLGRVQPRQPTLAVTGYLVILNARRGATKRPVHIDVGPRREMDNAPRDGRDRHGLGWRPAVLAHPLTCTPAPEIGRTPTNRPT